ncbi:TetR family transcriptional regulator [Nocardioides currus]|nr:TetR family transcriptional regulator [Nocardioides currus]
MAAALALFSTRGFDATTVDDIAERAGVERTTFFRAFASKEAVISPDHDAVLASIEARLAASSPSTRMIAVADAAHLVLDHNRGEGDFARFRYRLTSIVPALRARSVAQRTFARFLGAWWADETDGPLRAELTAAAVVTEAEFDYAVALAPAMRESDVAVVVLGGSPANETLAARVRRSLNGT